MSIIVISAIGAARDAALHTCAITYARFLDWIARQLFHLAEFISDGADDIRGAE
jgi:hypothetical protein